MIFRRIKKHLLENNSPRQTIIKNSFWLLASEFISKLFTFIVTLRIARHLGVEQFGVSNFVMTFVGFFVIVTDFGLSNLVYREISKHSESLEKYFVNALVLKLLLSLGIILIAFVVSCLVGKAHAYQGLIMLYLGYAILTNFSEFVRVFFRPSEHMQYEAFLKIITAIIFVIFSYIFIVRFGTLEGLFFGYFISSVAYFLFSFVYTTKKLHIKNFSVDKKFMKNLARMAIPFFLGGIFVYFYSDINIVMLGFFRGEHDVGIFSAPYRIIFYVYILLNIFSISFFKKLVDGTKKIEQFKHFLNKYILVSLGISGFFVLCVLIFGGRIITTVYGDKYVGSILIFKLLSFLVIAKSLSYVFGTGLTSFSQEYKRFWIQVVVAGINVILNL
ncbi:MAG: flippase, partial [Candidatus Absconditabacterales bacterium]